MAYTLVLMGLAIFCQMDVHIILLNGRVLLLFFFYVTVHVVIVGYTLREMHYSANM